jgi:hypothetical protein
MPKAALLKPLVGTAKTGVGLGVFDGVEVASEEPQDASAM